MLSLEEVKNVYRESNQKKKKKSEPKPKPQQRYQPKYDRSSKSTHRTRQPANTKPYVSKGVQEQQKKAYNQTAGGRFTQGFIRNGMMAGLPSETKATYTDSNDKQRKVSESKAYKAGKVIGDFASYGTGYSLAGKAIARATGKAVAKKAIKEVGEKAAKETAEKAVKKTTEKTVAKTAGKLAKAEDKVATKAGEKILKTNEKLGNKIAKSKAVQKYAEKKASKASEVAKIAGTAKRKEAIAKDVGAKAADKITKNLIADATAGTVLDTARAKGEGMDIGLNKEYAKYMGTNALLNVGMGAGMEGLGAGAKAVARSQAARKGAQTVRKLVNGKQKDVKIKNETHVPSTLKGRENAEKVGKIQKDFTEMPTVPKGQKMKDALSPEEIRQRRNVQNRYSEVTKESRARQEARGDYNRSLKKKGVQEERVRQVKDIAPEMPKSADDYVARINTARKYADDNNINFSDVVKEHNGNRAEAINDLVARAEESKPVRAEEPTAEVKNVNDSKQTGATEPNKATLDKDEIIASAEGNSKSALDDIENERDFEAWSDYGSEEGAKHVDDALEWMEKNGLDTKDSVLYDEVLARMYLNEKNAAKAAEPTVTAEPKAEVKKPKETVAEQPKVEQPTAEQPKEQNTGEFKSSERPQRPTGDSGKVSDMADTVRNAHFQTKESKELMDDIIADGTLNKRYMGNKQAVSMAEKKVSERGADDVAKTFMNNVDDGFEMTSERVAEAYTCMKHYVETGQYDKVEALAERLVHVESEAGRTLQSARLFRSLSPTGRVDAVVKNVKKLNGINGTDIKVPKELLDNLRNAKTQNELNEANKAISMHVWSKIPANWVEKANAWRYLAMLGNPKTHLRNIVGNVVFYPAKTMRNVLATGMEHALLPKAERTKAIMNYASSKDRALWKLGNDSFNNGMKDMLRGQSKYIESGGAHNLGRRDMDAPIFKSKLLNGLYHLNGKMLDAEDVAFMRPAYNTAYAQFLKAKGFTAQTASNEMLKRAEKYAAEEALNSTYRDFNVIANKLNKVKRYANMKTKDIPSSLDQKVMSDKRLKKAAGVAAEALVPFAKTPANILARGIEYSPAGIAQGITKILKSSTSDEVVEGISNLCAGLTGSSVVALGMYFGREGLATGQLDFTSKEDNYDKMLGAQPYSVNINGKSFTVDTVAPISIPFFVGVEAGSSMRNEGIGKDGITLFSVADKIADPVLNLSMLSSLNNVFNNRFSAGNSISSVARKTAQSYLGQYVPTLGSQFARVNQSEYTTTTATNEDPNIREYQRFVNQMKNKVPKLADSNAPKVDNWGEKETNDRWSLKSIWQNTANPFNVKELKGDANTLRIGAGEAPYVDTVEGDDVDSELKSLMDQGAENSVLPSSRPSSYAVKYNGEELRMSPKEFSKMQENTGTESKKRLRELFNSDEYKEAGLEDKQKLIEKVYSNVKLDAKRKFLKSRGYTDADISWNLDLSEKDKEDFGSKSKFLKALKKTGVSVSDFAEMKSEGLRVTELKAAAEMGISLKNYHIASEAKKKYKNGYASTLAELYEKGIIKNLDEAKVYDSDAKKYTFNYAKAMIDAGYTADEIYEKTGDMDAVREEVKKNYGNTVHKDGKVFMSREGLKAYLDSRKDLTDKDRYNLWLVYGGAGNGWWNRNPY